MSKKTQREAALNGIITREMEFYHIIIQVALHMRGQMELSV